MDSKPAWATASEEGGEGKGREGTDNLTTEGSLLLTCRPLCLSLLN
jgi:hypothetical protein